MDFRFDTKKITEEALKGIKYNLVIIGTSKNLYTTKYKKTINQYLIEEATEILK